MEIMEIMEYLNVIQLFGIIEIFEYACLMMEHIGGGYLHHIT